MSDRAKLYRSGARALTGLAIIAAAAAGSLMLGVVRFPTVERAPHAVQVDTTQTGERNLVCAGSFAELGADPSQPDVAIPVGQANVSVSGDGRTGSLGANASDATSLGGAAVLTGGANDPLAAAQTQRLDSSTLKGLVASDCVEPVNEQWLVGGASTLGTSTTLSLGNASDVPATVQIAVFDENGEIPALQTAGVIVAPHSQQTVSLSGYAPDSARLAVKVSSTGAPVAASLGVARIDGLNPVGAATVTRQLRASTSLVIPGVGLSDERNHEGPGDAGPEDRFPVVVDAIAPGNASGTAHVFSLDGAGIRTELGSIALAPKTVGSLTVKTWPSDATAVVVESDVPIFAGAQGTANASAGHDFDWFAPAPELEAGAQVAVAVPSGWTLVLVNTGTAPAEVRITGGTPSTVTVQQGTSMLVPASGAVTVSSSEPIHAAARMIDASSIAGYPVLPLVDRGGEITVYTR